MMPAATGAGAGTAGFAARYSLETTKPTTAEIAAIAALVPGGTEVYITAVPTLAAG